MAKKYRPIAKQKEPDKLPKKNRKIAAVIDIGSNTIRLKIAQNIGGEVDVLEDLRYPLSLGADTFNIGKLRPETIHQLCGVLSNYITVIEQYDIKSFRTIATTAIREASNSDYVVDIIKLRTGITVDVLNDVDDKSYTYRYVVRNFGTDKLDITSALMTYIGMGNLGVSIYENGAFPFIHSLRLGSLRLSELFEHVVDYSENYFRVVDEYQYGIIDDLRVLMPKARTTHFVACGSEVEFISRICDGEIRGQFMYIMKEKFLAQFDVVKEKTYDQLMEDYEITENRAELLVPFMSMCKSLLSLTDAEEVIMPLANLRDAILYEELFPMDAAREMEQFNKNVIVGAQCMAARYDVDIKHSDVITKFTLLIFEKLKRHGGFTIKDGILLHAAAIMHDIGKFINIKNHDNHAYTIIRGSDIAGLNPDDTETVALITKFNGKMPSNEPEYTRLTAKRKVLVSKLAAILGVAEALDRSHTQKFGTIDLKLENSLFTITVTTHKDVSLEEWAFKTRVLAFEEIFGLKAVLKIKKAY